MPVSAIRTKIRQEFEKHRYVAQIKTVDVLLYKSHAEFQVSLPFTFGPSHTDTGKTATNQLLLVARTVPVVLSRPMLTSL